MLLPTGQFPRGEIVPGFPCDPSPQRRRHPSSVTPSSINSSQVGNPSAESYMPSSIAVLSAGLKKGLRGPCQTSNPACPPNITCLPCTIFRMLPVPEAYTVCGFSGPENIHASMSHSLLWVSLQCKLVLGSVWQHACNLSVLV